MKTKANLRIRFSPKQTRQSVQDALDTEEESPRDKVRGKRTEICSGSSQPRSPAPFQVIRRDRSAPAV